MCIIEYRILKERYVLSIQNIVLFGLFIDSFLRYKWTNNGRAFLINQFGFEMSNI